MRILLSLFLWTVGITFFLISFLILAFCLTALPREKTFALARRLFSVQIRLMGIHLEVRGRENIDPAKTYLIMGNHQSLFDLFVIPSAVPLVFTGVEAAYHFSIPVWGHLIRKWGCIPIQRSNLEQAKMSLKQAEKTLAAGLSIAVLPEGHRTRTGKMGPFKKGPFHLAMNTRANILPFGIRGLCDFQCRGGFLLNPGKVEVHIGKPVCFEEVSSLSPEELRDLIFEKIQKLAKES
ncbi:lysophospholipid acyltransferase family protein [Desulfospira joergensenii]|uniref:lysophospholipid acyltransferase family protein n=1 Tax=Desulfospira joergensenii TaxID=53329 RepID=UPI0003B55C6F|nr:lysophospholipid acyltransferase family protein [Desulfospira joergensenii]